MSEQEPTKSWTIYPYILALKPAVLIGAVAFWVAGVVAGLILQEGQSGISWLAATQSLLLCGASLSLRISPYIRKKALQPDVSFESIQGPYWITTVLLGTLGLVIGLS